MPSPWATRLLAQAMSIGGHGGELERDIHRDIRGVAGQALFGNWFESWLCDGQTAIKIMSTVNVELAEELLRAAGISDAQPSRSAAKLIALELFREHRISLGKAAELAGVSVEEFMAFSAQREVPLHYTLADWEADQATARELKL